MYENLKFREKDCWYYRVKVRKPRLGIGDAETIQNYFVNQFYHVMDMDDKSCLQNVFWTDPRWWVVYEYFDVVTFDTT